MKKFICLLLILIMCLPTVAMAEEVTEPVAETWRSVLYPEDWVPGYTTDDGMFIQDFSYAGYHMGERDLPDSIGDVFNVVDYGADPTGEGYSTDAIQEAVDAAQEAGGGTVYIPEGIFKVRPAVLGSEAVIRIDSSNILIKGAGSDKTKIYNDEPYMRSTSVFLFSPKDFTEWHLVEESYAVNLREDVKEGDFVIPVETTDGFAVGEWVMLKNTITSAFIEEHSQTNLWQTSLPPLMYYRQILEVDADRNTITVDIPVRYPMKTRDSARVAKLAIPHLEEVGIQDMSFGMLENLKSGLSEEDYTTEGTAAYEVHLANFVKFQHCVNGWATNLTTFKPEQNTKDIHTLSGGIYLRYSRGITVTDCSMQKSLFEGGGGNGYLFNLKGQECLVKNCYAYHGRHNFSFGGLYCSGNVLTSSTTVKAARETDMHMHLAHANLLDNMTVNGDQLEGINRNSYGSTSKHGHSSTQVVFWNTNGLAYQSGESSIVETQQYGMGYAVGTRGTATAVKAYEGDNTSPMDFVEGVGMADTLEPQSLYADQLEKRLERMGAPRITHTIPEQGGNLHKDSYVKIFFDRPMDYDSFNLESVSASAESYTFGYGLDDDNAFRVDPNGMQAGQSYNIVLNKGVQSADGVNLLNDFKLNFNVVEDKYEVTDERLFVGDGFAYGEVNVVNNTTQPLDALLMTALYEGDKLIDIQITEKKIVHGIKTYISTDMATIPEGKEDCHYKLMLWDKNTLSQLVDTIKKDSNDLSSLNLLPVADAHVRNGGSYNNANYGSETALGIKYGTSGYQRKAYLKFDLTGQQGTIRKATLKLYGYASDTISSTIKIGSVADNTWLEDKITWNNAPTIGEQLGTMTYTGEGAWCEIDVTDYINNNMGSQLSFGVNTSSKDYLSISSREAEANRPLLVLEY